jgi:hypothetical protein
LAIELTTTAGSKQALLTELEIRLQEQTLKIDPGFQQLVSELRDYRLPAGSTADDSVMALGFAVTHAHHAHAVKPGGRINGPLLLYLNGLAKRPPGWLDKHLQPGLTMRGPNGLIYTNIDPQDRKLKLPARLRRRRDANRRCEVTHRSDDEQLFAPCSGSYQPASGTHTHTHTHTGPPGRPPEQRRSISRGVDHQNGLPTSRSTRMATGLEQADPPPATFATTSAPPLYAFHPRRHPLVVRAALRSRSAASLSSMDR